MFCFDPRDFGKAANGFDRTGPYRAHFLVEAVRDLRARLQDAGSDLLVRVGRPEEVLPELAAAVLAGAVFCHRDVAHEADAEVERAVGDALQDKGVALEALWGSTLYHVDDLPFSLADMPLHYAAFREQVHRAAIRATVPSDEGVKGLPAGRLDLGEVPTLRELGVAEAGAAAGSGAGRGPADTGVVGGETEALRRLEAFAAEAARPAGAEGPRANFPGQVSPWLSLGCVSPRTIFERLRGALGEGPRGVNWLVFEVRTCGRRAAGRGRGLTEKEKSCSGATSSSSPPPSTPPVRPRPGRRRRE